MESHMAWYPRGPLHSDRGMGIGPSPWDLLVISHSTPVAGLTEWRSGLLKAQVTH